MSRGKERNLKGVSFASSGFSAEGTFSICGDGNSKDAVYCIVWYGNVRAVAEVAPASNPAGGRV